MNNKTVRGQEVIKKAALRIVPYLLSAGAGGIVLLLLLIFGQSPRFAKLVDQATDQVVEWRSDAILTATSLPDKRATAHITVGSSCLGFHYSCTYAADVYVFDLDGTEGHVYLRRLFDSRHVPPGLIDNRELEQCELNSERIPIARGEVRRIAHLLTLAHFLDFKSEAGIGPTDTSPTRVEMTVDGRRVEVLMDSEASAPERFGKLVRLLYQQAEGKVRVPETWPGNKKCRL